MKPEEVIVSLCNALRTATERALEAEAMLKGTGKMIQNRGQFVRMVEGTLEKAIPFVTGSYMDGEVQALVERLKNHLEHW